MRIRSYQSSDWSELLRMQRTLFPHWDSPADDASLHDTLARPDAAIFVIDRDEGTSLAGFVEVGARSIADGCSTSPVGYVEAWYVDPDLRRSGFGRSLLEAGEAWARSKGFTEMASDALIDNDVSHTAHKRSGYEEVDRVVTYRKTLG